MRRLNWALTCATALWLVSGGLAQESSPLPPSQLMPACGDYTTERLSCPAQDWAPDYVFLASQTTLADRAYRTAYSEPGLQMAPLPPDMSAASNDSPFVLEDSSPVLGEYVPQTTLDEPLPDDVRIERPCVAYRGPYFVTVVESILWRLEHTEGRVVARNPGLGTSTHTDDLDLDMSFGPRVSTCYLSDESMDIAGIEVGYFGIYDWDDTMRLVAPGGTFLRLPDSLGDPGVTTDFSGADSMRLYSESRLNSVDVNVLFGDPAAQFNFIFGPRFIQLNEDFSIHSFTGPSVSSYEVSTRNELLGLQAGARYRRLRGPWELNSNLKIGAYNNKARQSTFMTDENRTVVLRNFSNRETEAAFVLDGQINITRWINRNWLIRVGYSVFYMDNVARAADQLDFSDNATSGGWVFFRQEAVAHGLNVGLEGRW